MTLSALRRVDPDDATLLRRAGRGDRRAARMFGRRHVERAVQVVELLVDDAEQAGRVAAQVLAATVAAGVPGDDALVRCAVRVAAAYTRPAGLARLVAALVDGDGRTTEDVADLIGCTTAEISELRALAYAAVGPAPTYTRECRGWPLVARSERLTAAEREAASGHLTLCRQCRVQLDEQRRTRSKVWVRGGAVSAVVAADVVALSLPAGGAVAGSGVASVLAGKAGMAVVGATALAVTVTSATVAVARTSPAQPHRVPVPVVTPQHRPGGESSRPQPGSGARAVPATAAPAGSAPGSPPPAKTQSTGNGPTTPVRLPAVVPTVPSVPLPTALPTLPLPTVSVSVPPLQLPLPSHSPLLGH